MVKVDFGVVDSRPGVVDRPGVLGVVDRLPGSAVVVVRSNMDLAIIILDLPGCPDDFSASRISASSAARRDCSSLFSSVFSSSSSVCCGGDTPTSAKSPADVFIGVVVVGVVVVVVVVVVAVIKAVAFVVLAVVAVVAVVVVDFASDVFVVAAVVDTFLEKAEMVVVFVSAVVVVVVVIDVLAAADDDAMGIEPAAVAVVFVVDKPNFLAAGAAVVVATAAADDGAADNAVVIVVELAPATPALLVPPLPTTSAIFSLGFFHFGLAVFSVLADSGVSGSCLAASCFAFIISMKESCGFGGAFFADGESVPAEAAVVKAAEGVDADDSGVLLFAVFFAVDVDVVVFSAGDEDDAFEENIEMRFIRSLEGFTFTLIAAVSSAFDDDVDVVLESPVGDAVVVVAVFAVVVVVVVAMVLVVVSVEAGVDSGVAEAASFDNSSFLAAFSVSAVSVAAAAAAAAAAVAAAVMDLGLASLV